MKNITAILLVLIPLFATAQQDAYRTTSFLKDGIKAPNTHHLGDAWLNFLVEANTDFNQNITKATFSANATLDWHKHTTAQILIVLDGVGYYQERDKEPILLKKGDVIHCAKDTEHWHSSSAENSVSYVAIYGKEPTIWTRKLSREYYNSVAKKLERN